MLTTKERTFLNLGLTSPPTPGSWYVGQAVWWGKDGLGSKGFTGSKNCPHKFREEELNRASFQGVWATERQRNPESYEE